MLIVADENIPLLDAFFAGFGEIRRLPGRAIDRAAVADADVLLVRSVTPVSRELQGSRVRFVGTCTIGTDHLDLGYFHEAGIHWSSAPGCNARGVVDYVLGSLLTLAEIEGVELLGRTYGVIGAGEVGGRLVKVLRGLGWKVLVCDPPRQATEGGEYVDLRGPVVDNAALREVLLDREDLQAVLDVWEAEPQVDVELAALCLLGSPHIGGYSLDGRQRGTAQIYQAYCAFSGQEPVVRLEDLLPEPGLAQITLNASCDPASAMATICRAVYDPRRDDANFRRSLVGSVAEQRAAFDLLRKHYPPRREIEGLAVKINGDSEELRRMVLALGAVLV